MNWIAKLLLSSLLLSLISLALARIWSPDKDDPRTLIAPVNTAYHFAIVALVSFGLLLILSALLLIWFGGSTSSE